VCSGAGQESGQLEQPGEQYAAGDRGLHVGLEDDRVAEGKRRGDGVYPATHGPGSVLSHFVSTVAQTGHPGAAAAAKLGEAGSTLLAGTLLDDGDLAGTDAVDDMRAHVIWYVRAHLGDPQLSRSSIAAAHHMSARTLDRLFADQPWSVSGLIRHERLEAARRDLEDPLLRHRSVAALAAQWCFFDAAHFSRVFRQHYGYPPSQTRSGMSPRL
jgi:AraC-like DNA-binding protein